MDRQNRRGMFTRARIGLKSRTNVSSEDARGLRALQRQEEQKRQRNRALSRNRCLVTPQQSNYANAKSTVLNPSPPQNPSITLPSTSKKYSKKELDELGRVRYEKMLLWKEEKRKHLELEKRKRKPIFKTGIYKPDAPKFLDGSDIQLDPDRKTPWMSSGPSKEVKLTKNRPLNSNATRHLKFCTGVTPMIKKNTQQVGNKANGSRRLRRANRLTPNDFGIAPLPITPAGLPTNLQKQVRSQEQSFAPQNFSFQAPKGLPEYDLTIQGEQGLFTTSAGRFTEHSSIPEESDEVPEGNFESSEGADRGFNQQSSDTLNSTFVHSMGSVEDQVTSPSNDHSQNNDTLNSTFIQEKITTPAEIIDNNVDPLSIMASDDNEIYNKEFATEEVTSDPEEDGPRLSVLEIKHLVQNAGHTPAPTQVLRRRTKPSVRKEDVPHLICTPPFLRLRPRTPCTRSTRRSQTTHCDHFDLDSLITPKSAIRRTSKKLGSKKNSVTFSSDSASTKNVSVTLDCMDVEGLTATTPCTDIVSELCNENAAKEDEPFKTPVSLFVKKTPYRISPLLDTNVCISRSRGSSSSRKKRNGIFSNELESMFNHLPLDGSLPEKMWEEIMPPVRDKNIGASPDLAKVGHSETNPLPLKNDELKSTELLKMLEPSSQVKEICSQEHPMGEREPLSELSNSPHLKLKNKRSRSKSKRGSVSFAVDVGHEQPGVKFPTTPIKRISSTSYENDFSSNIQPENECSEPLVKGENELQVKKESCQSLFPGLEPWENGGGSPSIAEGDLISFNRPSVSEGKLQENKRKRISNVLCETPALRRSKRLSTRPLLS